jgi:DNA invertase Pin-like site-specific DNA recombinase
VAELERSQIRERISEGILIAKQKGVYKGRKIGTSETVLKFLSKPKNANALEYLKKGLKIKEITQLTGLNANTICKVKKLGIN